MQSKIRFILAAFLLVILIPKAGISQVAITAVPFLQIDSDTRSMGLGGSTVAMMGGIGGMHLNPATIGKKNTLEIYSPINIDGSQPFFSSPWLSSFNSDLYLQSPGAIFSKDRWAVGYQHKYLSLGEQQVRDENGFPTNQTFDSYEYVHTFSASYKISKNIMVGAGYSFGKSVIARGAVVGENYKSPSFETFDVGIYADHTYEGKDFLFTPSIGWAINDYGQPIGYGTGRKDPLPMMMRLGLGLRADSKKRVSDRTAFSMAGYASLSKIMARLKAEETPEGVVYKPMGPWKALFNSWDTYTRFNGQRNVDLSLAEQLQTQVGLEFIFLEMMSFRFGYYYEDRQNGDRSYATLGVGFKHKYFSFNYAVIDDGDQSRLNGTQSLQFKVNVPLNF